MSQGPYLISFVRDTGCLVNTGHCELMATDYSFDFVWRDRYISVL